MKITLSGGPLKVPGPITHVPWPEDGLRHVEHDEQPDRGQGRRKDPRPCNPASTGRPRGQQEEDERDDEKMRSPKVISRSSKPKNAKA